VMMATATLGGREITAQNLRGSGSRSRGNHLNIERNTEDSVQQPPQVSSFVMVNKRRKQTVQSGGEVELSLAAASHIIKVLTREPKRMEKGTGKGEDWYKSSEASDAFCWIVNLQMVGPDDPCELHMKVAKANGRMESILIKKRESEFQVELCGNLGCDYFGFRDVRMVVGPFHVPGQQFTTCRDDTACHWDVNTSHAALENLVESGDLHMTPLGSGWYQSGLRQDFCGIVGAKEGEKCNLVVQAPHTGRSPVSKIRIFDENGDYQRDMDLCKIPAAACTQSVGLVRFPMLSYDASLARCDDAQMKQDLNDVFFPNDHWDADARPGDLRTILAENGIFAGTGALKHEGLTMVGNINGIRCGSMKLSVEIKIPSTTDMDASATIFKLQSVEASGTQLIAGAKEVWMRGTGSDDTAGKAITDGDSEDDAICGSANNTCDAVYPGTRLVKRGERVYNLATVKEDETRALETVLDKGVSIFDLFGEVQSNGDRTVPLQAGVQSGIWKSNVMQPFVAGVASGIQLVGHHVQDGDRRVTMISLDRVGTGEISRSIMQICWNLESCQQITDKYGRPFQIQKDEEANKLILTRSLEEFVKKTLEDSIAKNIKMSKTGSPNVYSLTQECNTTECSEGKEGQELRIQLADPQPQAGGEAEGGVGQIFVRFKASTQTAKIFGFDGQNPVSKGQDVYLHNAFLCKCVQKCTELTDRLNVSFKATAGAEDVMIQKIG